MCSKNTENTNNIYPYNFGFGDVNKTEILYSTPNRPGLTSIYKRKPLFSIFGIGDYSFKPYKVAISGMYKSTTFSLVTPNNNKPIMLDDTCYFIGFDTLIEAEITQFLLNKNIAQQFIHSIAFTDAKRMITKDLLMRINLTEIIKNTNFIELKTQIEHINKQDWINYKDRLDKKDFEKNQQLEFFGKYALPAVRPSL